DLHFIAAHKVNAAVAATLAGSLHFGGRGELHVQLAVAELLLGSDRSPGRCRHAVVNLPFVSAFPTVEILPVKQYDRITRHAARRSGIDDRRLGPNDA